MHKILITLCFNQKIGKWAREENWRAINRGDEGCRDSKEEERKEGGGIRKGRWGGKAVKIKLLVYDMLLYIREPNLSFTRKFLNHQPIQLDTESLYNHQ